MPDAFVVKSLLSLEVQIRLIVTSYPDERNRF